MHSTLAGEWGLSLHLESRNAGAARQYLLDFGYTPEVLLRNFSLLGIEPERLDGLILSHGHRDHYGGVSRLLGPSNARRREPMAICLGGQARYSAVRSGSGGQDGRMSYA